MGNFCPKPTVLFVHLAKYESISMVPKVYIHFCTTVCQFEKPEKRHFFIPYYFIMFCGPRYCFNWENARHFWAETKRILSIINRHLIATCHKKKKQAVELTFKLFKQHNVVPPVEMVTHLSEFFMIRIEIFFLIRLLTLVRRSPMRKCVLCSNFSVGRHPYRSSCELLG